MDVRFIVVDDTTGRDDELRGLRPLPDVTVVTPPFNLGHQRGIVYGLRRCLPMYDDSDCVVTMDADGEDRPEDLPRLIEPIPVLASRPGQGGRRSPDRADRVVQVPYALHPVPSRVPDLRRDHGSQWQLRRVPRLAGRRMLQHPYFDLCYSSTLISLDLDVTMVPCPRGSR